MKKFSAVILFLLFVFLLPKIYAFALSAKAYDLADQKVVETIEKGANVLDLSEFAYLTSIPENAYRIKNLTRLDISRTRIVDIKKLNSFNELNHLNIRQTRIDDISSISEIKTLQSLDIGATRISDLTPLSDLENLDRLQMDRTFIQSLCPLTNVAKLNWLNLYKSYSIDGSQGCFQDLEKDIDELGGGSAFRQNYIPGKLYLSRVTLDRFLETFEWKSLFKAIQGREHQDG